MSCSIGRSATVRRIRAADPQALIAGPAEWGWTGYFYSARDVAMGFAMRPESAGARRCAVDPVVSETAARVRAQEPHADLGRARCAFLSASGRRVRCQHRRSGGCGARIRSTRALWDPSYKDESWIDDTVRLIPRLRDWVAQNSPGLKISIGEYNFGGELEMSGGLALAEALGRFGTEGLDYAYYWSAPPKDSPTYWAFRAYRNFDGKGGHFLEGSVKTRASPGVSLFASRGDAGKHLVLVALNLEPSSAVQARIQLAGCSQPAQLKKFRYLAGYPSITEEPIEGNGPLRSIIAALFDHGLRCPAEVTSAAQIDLGFSNWLETSKGRIRAIFCVIPLVEVFEASFDPGSLPIRSGRVARSLVPQGRDERGQQSPRVGAPRHRNSRQLNRG